jgi:hypothetical protein
MIWKQVAMEWTKYCPGIYMEGLRRSMKVLIQDGRCPAEIRNKDLVNTSLENYRYVNPLNVYILNKQ